MKIYTDFDLSQFNSYRIKASCRMAMFPETEDDIREIFLDGKGAKKILLGSGHNIILSKEYYEEEFIIFSNTYDNVVVNDNCLEAEAGVTMLELSKLALLNSLSGLEVFYDIPSSLGGAVVMNAGASGEEIKDLVIDVRCYDPISDKFFSLKQNEIKFGYRTSLFQESPNLIVTKATLELKKGIKDSIQKKMQEVKTARWSKQPKEFPNAGSVFKRPEGYYVGTLIDELNLKGFSIGGAQISEKHGGFIININKATGNDILNLIDEVKKRVRNKYKIELEVEQRII
ncbi:UDP-N-acetylmuramate dehydrogenase [Pontibacter sp. MBLB2868]|uniref:UDP-N-acetylmuramate dehydrogenase n=1 Tax=Pontibacter sp. MBLB2868 TaxID=3451555 RepID=UPI003F74EDBD